MGHHLKSRVKSRVKSRAPADVKSDVKNSLPLKGGFSRPISQPRLSHHFDTGRRVMSLIWIIARATVGHELRARALLDRQNPNRTTPKAA